jgi:hypothetical protein
MKHKILLEDTRIKLAVLWIFVLFNYLYADVLTLMDSSVLKELIAGSVAGLQITPSLLLIGAILMEIPIAMIILSLVLKYTINRWVNIIAGLISSLAVAASLFVGTPAPYYAFFGIIEVITTCSIVWIAWKWQDSS